MRRFCTPSGHIESARLAHEAVARLPSLAPAQAMVAGILHQLIDEAGQDYALDQVPSPLAIGSFGLLLQHVGCDLPPVLSLTPSGGIWAEWSDAARRNVAIFVGQDGRARLGAVLMVQESCRLPLLLELDGDIEAILERLRTDRDLGWVRSPQAQAGIGAGTESGA